MSAISSSYRPPFEQLIPGATALSGRRTAPSNMPPGSVSVTYISRSIPLGGPRNPNSRGRESLSQVLCADSAAETPCARRSRFSVPLSAPRYTTSAYVPLGALIAAPRFALYPLSRRGSRPARNCYEVRAAVLVGEVRSFSAKIALDRARVI